MRLSKCFGGLTSRRPLGLLILLLTTAGCASDGDLELVPAGGALTYRNRPLENVTVTFIPERGPLAHGLTDSDGSFFLTTGTRPGIVAGPAKVVISAGRVSTSRAPDDSIGIPRSSVEHENYLKRLGEFQVGNQTGAPTITEPAIIPQKYESLQTSGLSFIVEPQGENDFLIELTD